MAQGQGNPAVSQLVKGSGCGTREWREDFVLTDTDGETPLFSVSKTDGSVNMENGLVLKADSTGVGAVVVGKQSEGTIAAPTAIQAGDALLFVGGKGYGATQYSTSSVVAMQMVAAENFTDSANGTQIKFQTTPNGSTSRAVAVVIDSDKTLQLQGPMKLKAIETGLTAHAGGGQGSALALDASKTVHNVTTVGTAADSVALPASTGNGNLHFVKNSAASNSMQVFGAGTDTIDGVATDTGVAIAAGKSALFIDAAAGNWLRLAGA